jgi:hypothetical protein
MAYAAKNKTRGSVSEMSASVRSRRIRERMECEWGFVLDMLTGVGGKKPRRHKDGRTLTEVWADMVLADPAGEFARVAQHLLMPEPDASASGGNVVTNIQSLYLTALQAASREPNPRTIEHTQPEADQGANGVQPAVSNW